MPDHVLSDIHRYKLLAVVHRDGMADELRQDRGTPGPGANDLLLVGRIEHRELGFQVRVRERSLLYASTHGLPLLALAVDDPLIGALVVAGLETTGRLAPRRHRMAAARGAALAA